MYMYICSIKIQGTNIERVHSNMQIILPKLTLFLNVRLCHVFRRCIEHEKEE